jgi:FkbM family methyltransferase
MSLVENVQKIDRRFGIFEFLSWMPRRIQLKIFGGKKVVNLDLNGMGIDKKIRFYILEGDNGLSRELGAFGFREPLNCEFYYNFISSDDVVLDIGANLGWFSVLSSKAKKIISIEPIKDCIPIIEKNLKENGLEDKAIVINKAVGNEKTLFIKKMDKMNRSEVVEMEGLDVVRVKSNSLTYYINKFHANVIRMDLEGYEYDLLYGKDLSGVNKICLEYHTGIIGKKKTRKFLEFMQKEGFVIRYLVDDLPLRLYPFYKILKATGLIKKFVFLKKNIMPKNAYSYLLRGRTVKYLNFERKKK